MTISRQKKKVDAKTPRREATGIPRLGGCCLQMLSRFGMAWEAGQSRATRALLPPHLLHTPKLRLRCQFGAPACDDTPRLLRPFNHPPRCLTTIYPGSNATVPSATTLNLPYDWVCVLCIYYLSKHWPLKRCDCGVPAAC